MPARFLPAFAFMVLAACSGGQGELDTVEITITTSQGPRTLVVEHADEGHEHETGLMGRKTIGRHDGMLFTSPSEGVPAFWMKDTLIPLDMIFIRADGTIADIAADRQPGDLTEVSPDEPVRAVLELEGGRSDEMGLEAGDTVVWTPSAP